MTHEDAQTLIEEYESGTLSVERSAELRAHLDECEECRAEARIAASLRRVAAVSGEAMLSEHPDPEELAGYALADRSYPLDVLAGIQTHLEACETCRREVDLVREAARSPKGGSRRRNILPLFLLVLLAAVLIPLRFHQRGADRLPAPAGSAAVLTIPASATGTDAATPSVRLAPEQEFIPVSVGWIPTNIPIHIIIRTFKDGDAVPMLSFQVETDNSFDRDRGVLGLILPAARFEPGLYRLQVDGPDGRIRPGGQEFPYRRTLIRNSAISSATTLNNSATAANQEIPR